MNPNCFKCLSTISSSEFAECSQCEKTYHFNCFVNESSYRKAKLWKCLQCVGTRSKVQYNAEEMGRDISEIKNLLRDVNEKMTAFETIKNEMQDIKRSLNFISTQYDEFQRNFNEEKEKNKILSSKVSTLEKTVKDQHKVIMNLESKLNYPSNLIDPNQYSRNKNIEIHGIPVSQQENCVNTVLQVASELQLNIKKEDIDVAHRLSQRAGSKKPPPIIAQFTTRNKRDLLLQKKRLVIINKNIPQMQLGSAIYLNENLNKHIKYLLWIARNRASQYDFKFVWAKNGTIYIRKTDGSPVMTIHNEDDVLRIIGPDKSTIATS